MQKLHLTIIALLLPISSLVAESELPYEAKQLIHKRDITFIRINKGLKRELTTLKVKYTKRGDLESANKIAEYIKELQKISEREERDDLIDSIVGVKWSWYDDGTHAPKGRDSIVLYANHTGLHTHTSFTWEKTGDRQITLTSKKDRRKAVITWDKDLKKYSGRDFDGRSRVRGELIERR